MRARWNIVKYTVQFLNLLFQKKIFYSCILYTQWHMYNFVCICILNNTLDTCVLPNRRKHWIFHFFSLNFFFFFKICICHNFWKSRSLNFKYRVFLYYCESENFIFLIFFVYYYLFFSFINIYFFINNLFSNLFYFYFHI